MTKKNILEQLAKQLSDALPEQVGTLKKDFEKNCHSILMKAFSKLELVTREEFDAQSKVLARTRKKINALEAQLAEIEKQSKKK